MHGDDHERVASLLPWFVNDTLEPGERDRVRHHLDVCDACRSDVSMLSAVQSGVRRGTPVPLVPPPRTDRLLRMIEPAATAGRRAGKRILLAASVATAVLAGALFVTLKEDPAALPARYVTATSVPPEGSVNYVFDLQFDGDTPASERERLLRELEAGDIRAGTTAGTYRVTINLPAASIEELARYSREIESSPQIRSARVIAVQLPMSREK